MRYFTRGMAAVPAASTGDLKCQSLRADAPYMPEKEPGQVGTAHSGEVRKPKPAWTSLLEPHAAATMAIGLAAPGLPNGGAALTAGLRAAQHGTAASAARAMSAFASGPASEVGLQEGAAALHGPARATTMPAAPPAAGPRVSQRDDRPQRLSEPVPATAETVQPSNERQTDDIIPAKRRGFSFRSLLR